MAELSNVIRQELYEAVENDQLELPTLPEVALRIRETALSDDVSTRALAGVIAEDPALSARLIRVANSPAFRAINSIDDLHMAIGRIGVERAANLAAGLALEQLFQATSDLVDRQMRSTWAHACEVAAICSVLAKTFTNLQPDQATLAGLTHSIGVLPILSFVEENDTLIRDSFTLSSVIDSLHPSLGTIILQSWNFPQELCVVPAQYTDFDRDCDQVDYVDVVMVANLQALAHSNHPHANLDWTKIGAFNNLGLDPHLESPDLVEYHEEVDVAISTMV